MLTITSLRLFYTVQLPLHMADGDPVPMGDPPPTPTHAAGGSALNCEFCECRLAKDGSVLTVGKRAKKMRDLEDDLESAHALVAERDATISRLNQEIADLKAKLPKKSSGW